MEKGKWSVKKVVMAVRNRLLVIKQMTKNRLLTIKRLMLTKRTELLTRTAKLRQHQYVNTGISINKLNSDRYAGDVLRCERCDRVRVVLSDGDYGKAMREKGCVGFKNGGLKI